MRTTAEYLDAVKVKLKLPSDYALAKHWSVSKQDISSYRSGNRTLGEERAIEVAKILEIDPAEVLIAAQAERAKTDQAKEAWASLFDRLHEGFLALLPHAKFGDRRRLPRVVTG